MAIPAQYNGDLSLWYNDVVSKLSDSNQELAMVRRYWASLTTAQKTAVKTKIQGLIATGRTDLLAISTEIGTIA
jgi:hypothetical protein